MTREHEPLSSDPILLSEEKRAWCNKPWTKGQLEQPNIAVVLDRLFKTPRPSNPKQSIARGYTSLNKFHDREPEVALKAIEEIAPDLFNDYPRKPKTIFNDAFKKAAIGELARTYLRYGLSAYGKPDLRRDDGSSSDVFDEPL